MCVNIYIYGNVVARVAAPDATILAPGAELKPYENTGRLSALLRSPPPHSSNSRSPFSLAVRLFSPILGETRPNTPTTPGDDELRAGHDPLAGVNSLPSLSLYPCRAAAQWDTGVSLGLRRGWGIYRLLLGDSPHCAVRRSFLSLCLCARLRVSRFFFGSRVCRADFFFFSRNYTRRPLILLRARGLFVRE